MNKELGIRDKRQARENRNTIFGIIHNSKFPILVKQLRGFTLVEVLVSVSIFSLIMLMVTGSVFTIVDANKKTHSIKSVMTNLNFALESMSREIRVGQTFECLGPSGSPVTGDGDDGYASNCKNGNVGFRFISNRNLDGSGGNDTIEYTYEDGKIYRWHKCVTNNPGCDDGPTPITAEEINIEDMSFYVVGASLSDDIQPRVIFTISGTVGEGNSASRFNIQTTASQRLIDL